MSAFNPANNHRKLCFTANIPAGKEWADFKMTTLRVGLNPTYMVAQPEEGSHRHWQGYAEFGSRKSGRAILKCFATWGIKAHLEVARGNAEQNREYCTKDDTCVNKELRFEFGEPQPGQGSRGDLAAMVEAIKTGASDKELLELNPRNFMVHHRAFQVVRQILAPKRTEPSKLVFIYGPTGTFKTRTAMTLEPELVQWDGGRFIVGYTGGKTAVLFDDFEWEKMDPKFFLRLIDRYPMEIGIKGGSMCWAPTVIVFTSNDDPAMWWPDAPEATRAAIHRRMEEYGEMQNLGEGTQWQENRLQNYFVSSRAAPVIPTSGATRGTPATEVIDISSDEECPESEASDYELRRRRRIGKRPEAPKRRKLWEQDAQKPQSDSDSD